MLSNTYKAMFPVLLDTMGLVGTMIGIFLGFYCLQVYDPVMAFDMMMLWSVCCVGIASFLGSMFFRRSTSKALGWKFGASFQIERAFYHLAFSITTMTLYFGNWGLEALLAIAYLFSLNLIFEIGLHAYDIFYYKVTSMQKIFRIFSNLVILIYLGYFGYQAYLYTHTI